MEKKRELNENELKKAVGGSDIDIRKDIYENIIIGAAPQEHNIMLTEEKDK